MKLQCTTGAKVIHNGMMRFQVKEVYFKGPLCVFLFVSATHTHTHTHPHAAPLLFSGC